MQWININVETIDSEAFLGSEPIDRATWLCLMRYCVGQENGGRIAGARDWTDRKWQQICRVTLAEVQRSTALWHWDNGDVIVLFYPSDKEAAVVARREAGRIGGLRSGEARRQASTQAPSEAHLQPSRNQTRSTASNFASTEGKGIEGNRNGREVQPPLPPDVTPHPTFPATAEAAVKAVVGVGCPPEFIVKTWTKAHARGGRDGRDIEIRSWASHVATEWAYEQERRSKASVAPATAQGGAFPPSIQSQIKATQELLVDVQKRIDAIKVPQGDLYPTERQKALDARAPLIEEKRQLMERLRELQRKLSEGAH